jgi:hypothetical protein
MSNMILSGDFNETIDCPICSQKIEYIPEGGNYLCMRCGVMWRKLNLTRKPKPSDIDHDGSIRTCKRNGDQANEIELLKGKLKAAALLLMAHHRVGHPPPVWGKHCETCKDQYEEIFSEVMD